MSDHCTEEQEMEAEALTAIFDTAFQIKKSTQPFVWSVHLVPVDCGGDEEEDEKTNHVGVNLLATLPLDYPESSLPELDVEIVKGLAKDHKNELIELANSEAEANEGMPAIFAVCEAVRSWLVENNVKGLDDGSMHAQMMRKQKEAEKNKMNKEQKFESQKKEDEMTQAELEEIAVRKRRAEGTPCTLENFLKWKAKFDEEMAQLAIEKEEKEREAMNMSGKKGGTANKEGKKDDATQSRLTGFEQFSGKAGLISLDAIEAAAEKEEEEEEEDEGEELDVDEELFDDDDDLDDLDFDSDDDEDEEDIDI